MVVGLRRSQFDRHDQKGKRIHGTPFLYQVVGELLFDHGEFGVDRISLQKIFNCMLFLPNLAKKFAVKNEGVCIFGILSEINLVVGYDFLGLSRQFRIGVVLAIPGLLEKTNLLVDYPPQDLTG